MHHFHEGMHSFCPEPDVWRGAKEINEDVKDAVGELTNMISGDSRRRLEEIGCHFIGAVPCVISGQGHEIKHISKGPILSIPFSTQGGTFNVEVCFK